MNTAQIIRDRMTQPTHIKVTTLDETLKQMLSIIYADSKQNIASHLFTNTDFNIDSVEKAINDPSHVLYHIFGRLYQLGYNVSVKSQQTNNSKDGLLVNWFIPKEYLDIRNMMNEKSAEFMKNSMPIVYEKNVIDHVNRIYQHIDNRARNGKHHYRFETFIQKQMLYEIDTTLRVIDYLKDEGFDVTYKKDDSSNNAIEFIIDIKW